MENRYDPDNNEQLDSEMNGQRDPEKHLQPEPEMHGQREPEMNDQRESESDFMEETAAEVVPLPERERVMDKADNHEETSEEDSDVTEGRGIGIFALALSVVSLFFLPILLGAAGIIVGYFARRRGANTLGNWAVGLGIASIVVSLLFAPFF